MNRPLCTGLEGVPLHAYYQVRTGSITINKPCHSSFRNFDISKQGNPGGETWIGSGPYLLHDGQLRAFIQLAPQDLIGVLPIEVRPVAGE